MFSNFCSTFSAAPHRLFFFSGAVQLILPLLFWSVELLGRYTSIWSPLNIMVPATWAHGFIMLYGLFTFFIYGFLMTVFPRWMNGEAIEKEKYIAAATWLNLGLIIFEISLFYNRSTLLSGLSIFLFGWLYASFLLWESVKQAPAKNKLYESTILLALLAGASGVAQFGWWIYSDNITFIELSYDTALWLYLLPILFTVSHRMLPFFSSNVIDNYKTYQPISLLIIFLLFSIVHFILEAQLLNQWLFIPDSIMATIALYLSFQWQFHRAFKDSLLAVLHMAFLWLGIGLVLYSLQSALLFFSGDYILNRAPLHAITIGFFSSMLIAMASRVTMGHSGRKLILDNTSWFLFLGIQLTAITRISAEISFNQALNSGYLNLITALLWLICMSIWFVKYAPLYLTGRIDGKPG